MIANGQEIKYQYFSLDPGLKSAGRGAFFDSSNIEQRRARNQAMVTKSLRAALVTRALEPPRSSISKPIY